MTAAALGLKILVLIFSLAAFQSCASRSMTLVHPQSGATVKCSAAGAGILVGSVEGIMAECTEKYARQGYVDVDKLTPQQRADLERRGLRPKE